MPKTKKVATKVAKEKTIKEVLKVNVEVGKCEECNGRGLKSVYELCSPCEGSGTL